MNQWLKLDNAAKVFPSVSSKRRTNLFRLSFKLKESIEPLALQEALNITINRFTTFNVRLKRGLFWYYLEKNNLKPNVIKEIPQVFKKWKTRENNGFLFRLSYYEKRVTLEVFHALTDGGGALEFLKSIIYIYLKLIGKDVSDEDILTEFEELIEEKQDSFVKNYDPTIIINRKEKKALQYNADLYKDNWISLISGAINAEELKKLSKKYNATITEFICTVLILSASKSLKVFEKKNKPFQVFIPVNLRRIFPSKTLRNFSLYVRTSMFIKKELDFQEVLEIVKEDMKNELNADKLLSRIVGNVKLEKNIFMRIVPLMIKEIVMKMGYNAWGESANSFSLSNLGVVNITSNMKNYIEYIEFSNGASFSAPINMGVVTFNNTIMMTFASTLEDKDIQKNFFRMLSDFGLDITIHTNDLEV